MRISVGSQLNYWGRSAPTGYGLDPQRSDLWFADFTNAVIGLRGVIAQGPVGATELGPMFITGTKAVMPQLVRSVSIPEVRLRTEPVRRGGAIAYNTPSWDDPLDSFKVQFVADVPADDAQQVITAENFIRFWMRFVRFGRGLRHEDTSDVFLFEEATGGALPFPEYRYSFSIYLLKGVPINSILMGTGGTASVLSRLGRAAAGAARSIGNAFRRPDAMLADSGNAITLDGSMVVSTSILIDRAWPTSIKLTDLSYESPGIVGLDVTFAAESISYTDGDVWF